ncbi:MAG: acyl-CoA dehydrogenase family protein [Ignavibacteriae bacterium]|nr:acyl-CoA dehydrogenase family protein [Ignavibacteriota bacterium]MCB9216762.1 acyl-CoA dehydrogenase family protein [Ignavibacteria bacterium]
MSADDTAVAGYNTSLNEEQVAIRDLARDFAEREIRPIVMEYDESQEFPTELFKKMAELGFLGVMVPVEYEGSNLGAVEFSLVVEEIARVDPSVALGVAAHNGLCTGHTLMFGSDELKAEYIPRLATGQTMGAWGLTEPGSGSDAGGMMTTARRDGDDWILNGSKNFITHGTVGEVAVIIAMSDPTLSPGKGASAFVLDKSMEGFYASKKENKLGMRCSDTSSLVMEDVRVPGKNLIGSAGEGFKQALKILDGGRISIAALSVGLAQGALDAALKYANERSQFGNNLAKYQAIQFKLAKMATDVTASRLLTHRAAFLRDTGQDYSLAASQAKLFASETAVRCAEEAVQIHGGYGYIKEYPVEKYYRDAKLLTIGEGTSEIQKLVIARHIMEA